jgi:hypothetical protein
MSWGVGLGGERVLETINSLVSERNFNCLNKYNHRALFTNAAYFLLINSIEELYEATPN